MEAVSVAPGLFYKGNIKRNTLFPLQTKKKKELIKLSREYETTTNSCVVHKRSKEEKVIDKSPFDRVLIAFFHLSLMS